jgi:hypothetical protein
MKIFWVVTIFQIDMINSIIRFIKLSVAGNTSAGNPYKCEMDMKIGKTSPKIFV